MAAEQLLAGRYRVVRRLAVGPRSTAYLADEELESATRRVAIELMAAEPHDAGRSARFRRDCESIAALHHPNTLRSFDFGELPDGCRYVVTEHVEGEALRSVLSYGPLPFERVRQIVGQLCGALGEAHALGITHGDLSPETVVVSPHGYTRDFVKIRFGVSGPVRQSVSEDVHALGALTYETLTGVAPFGEGGRDTPRRFEDAAPGLPLSVSAKRAILHALAKSPHDRPATPEQFFEELTGGGDSLLEGTPLRDLAEDRRQWAPYRLPIRRPGLGAVLAGMLVIGAAVFAGWLTWAWGTDSGPFLDEPTVTATGAPQADGDEPPRAKP
jgi:serine/threonine-protein kinase